jgi:transposase
MTLLLMSKTELSRVEVLQRVSDGRLSVKAAAELMGLSRRQATRLLKAYREVGAAGLISKKRGKPSNRSYSDGLRDYVVEIIRANYHDFGPTFAAEKLTELHEITVSKETLRNWMIEAGIWESRIERKKRVQQPRNRRECFGELIQIDGSLHWWFEDRGPQCSLLVFIDDATSKIVQLRFAP